ncbi:DUF5937 family protein [Amycolatopsis sp. NPDC049688]|uniref:ArsR/SmtB family transcription factor n=1 Tax=Amycolatopsis sp. NPDC049688 TaxID=3154733 RepID=UPI00342C3D96
MLRYELEPSDVSTMRFGISPLSELALGLRALRKPGAFPLQRPWTDLIGPARPFLDTEVLHGLVNERLWVADFVTPRPDSPLTDFDAELVELAELSPERLRGDLLRVHGTVPPVFAGPHDQVADRLRSALATAWKLCFAPYWQRMRAVLQADITHRGRLVAEAGIGRMLSGLSPAITYVGRHLDVRLTRPEPRLRPVRGEGVTLVPSMFVRRASVPLADELPPTVLYPARGQGTMWSTAPRPEPGAVRALIGSARAELLTMLGEPASSTELALRLGVTTSAVNQHLRVLLRSGLLNSARYGKSVLYYRSDLGDSLCGR